MKSDQSDKPVTLFVQCLVDAMYPDLGFSMVRLFEKLDIPFTIPENQTCCGQPAFNTGYRKAARTAAQKFIREFESADCIVSPSGSCVDMIRHQYPLLFPDGSAWQKRAKAIGKKVFELTEYLVDVRGITDVGSAFKGSVTYHDSCHLSRNLGVARQPRLLMENIPGLVLKEMNKSDKCCGFGGTFAVKYPEISSAILEEKVENIMATGADAVVGCDISCLMNIQGLLNRKGYPVKALHILQVLVND